MDSELHLAPKPRSLVEASAHPVLPRHVKIGVLRATDEFTLPAEMIREALRQRDVMADVVPLSDESDPFVRLTVEPSQFAKPQSYSLTVAVPGIELRGSDPSGLFYGAATLRQVLMAAPEEQPPTLPGVTIEDEPDFANRGVLLDVSRDRVPTMSTLFRLVDLLSSWKVNQLQLYMEHTFAYTGHEKVWEGSDPFTPDEIRELDHFCRQRYIELVPNQNSFGHMHRWLKHEPYRRLAECPEGSEHPFAHTTEPFSLCPLDPGSLDLLRDLYDQLLPNFGSDQFNVGLDETFDLGAGRSSEPCQRLGKGRVYLDFLRKIHGLVAQRGRRMQFWGDIIRNHPSLVEELPQDVIPLEWGYEGNHPFEENVRIYGRTGLSFYVCPGTSSWNSLAGRTDNALANLKNAARAGHAAGAAGYLITDWGDNGHLQPLPVSHAGFLAGACCAWNVEGSESLNVSTLASLLDAHAFGDRAGVMGRVACDLGNLYRAVEDDTPNGTAPFRLLMNPEMPGENVPSRAMADVLDRGLIDEVVKSLLEARMGGDDALLIRDEYTWVADMLKLACGIGRAKGRRESSAGGSVTGGSMPRPTSEPGGDYAQLSSELERLTAEHRRLWLQRSRPGGLDDSCVRLEKLLAILKSTQL